MKKLIMLISLFPAIVFGQSYKCKLSQSEWVKMKVNDKSTLTAEIYQDKKMISSCLFNSRFPASDARGVAAEVLQNYEKAGCSRMESGQEVKYQVSPKAYTKITHDKKSAIFFLLSDHQPMKCDLM